MGALTRHGAAAMIRVYREAGWEILSDPSPSADTTWRWTMHRPHG